MWCEIIYNLSLVLGKKLNGSMGSRIGGQGHTEAAHFVQTGKLTSSAGGTSTLSLASLLIDFAFQVGNWKEYGF